MLRDEDKELGGGPHWKSMEKALAGQQRGTDMMGLNMADSAGGGPREIEQSTPEEELGWAGDPELSHGWRVPAGVVFAKGSVGISDVELVPARIFVVAEKIGGHVLGAYNGALAGSLCLRIAGSARGTCLHHSHMLG